jgi:predicted dinucleotide-binding enzyme
MKIGIIGAGNVGRGVTRLVIGNGHQVVLSNSHGPDTLSALVAELGPDVTAGTVADAAREDIVVLAVPWAAVPDAVAGLPAWNARIVVDATNHFVRADDGIELADLGGRTSSEVVAGLLPGARVVKAFNSLPVRIFERDPRQAGGNRVLFVSGDDAAAKQEVQRLLEDLHFATIDLGDLRTGGGLQQAGGPLSGANLLRLP